MSDQNGPSAPGPWGEQPPQPYAGPYGSPYGPGQPGPQGQPPGYYQPPPAKKSRAVWWILGGLGVVLLVGLGGCLALVGLFVNEIDETIEEATARPEPQQVAEGESFTFDGFEFDEGWRVATDEYDRLSIKGLRATNVENDDLPGAGSSATLTFKLMDGTENLAEISCSSNRLDEGQSSAMDCFSSDEIPPAYETISVSSSW
ncbi:hypothetical protein [Nocardioides ferulae]|uniref:hypothetical protein n=1 Tax=Nocardioides ferulae TaxID=2340821 RepID=UPI000EB40AE6|nr:hypothetical protein [Nocardioides ferulae]